VKAARIHRHGEPEVLMHEDAAEPKTQANQVLVRVRACALSHLDFWVRAEIPGMQIAMPHILGSDIAGKVIATGEHVRADQRVLLAPGLSCRQCECCVSDEDKSSTLPLTRATHRRV
jgi:NADPH:quinone reductase-like Zn-dependent oxidoreductase